MVKRRRVFGMRARMVYKCMKLTAVLCGYWALGWVGLGFGKRDVYVHALCRWVGNE